MAPDINVLIVVPLVQTRFILRPLAAPSMAPFAVLEHSHRMHHITRMDEVDNRPQNEYLLGHLSKCNIFIISVVLKVSQRYTGLRSTQLRSQTSSMQDRPPLIPKACHACSPRNFTQRKPRAGLTGTSCKSSPSRGFPKGAGGLSQPDFNGKHSVLVSPQSRVRRWLFPSTCKISGFTVNSVMF